MHILISIYSLRPSDENMRQEDKPSSFQIMAWHRTGVKHYFVINCFIGPFNFNAIVMKFSVIHLINEKH